MSIFKPTDVNRTYSYNMWGTLSDGIILLERDADKIECSVSKIDIGDKGVRIKYEITNKSQKTLKVNRSTLSYALSHILLNGHSIFKESSLPISTYLYPHHSIEYTTLEANKKYTFTINPVPGKKYVNPKLAKSLDKLDGRGQLKYEYKADVIFMREPNKLFIQKIANKGIVETTYSAN